MSAPIVTTPPRTTALVSLASARRELGLDGLGPDADLSGLVAGASAAVVAYCSRPFARAAYTETITDYAGAYLTLARLPIVGAAPVVLYRGEVVVDFIVDDADAGSLYREQSWDANFTRGNLLTDPFRALEPMLSPYTVSYTAGYLLEDDNVSTQAVAVDGPAKTFTLSAKRWPLLVVGDLIVTAGFAQAGNNGIFTVVSRTDTVLTVAETLTTEAEATTEKTLTVATLPPDVARATLDVLRAHYFRRGTDPTIASKRIGDLAITYASGPSEPTSADGFPYSAAGLLAPWVQIK